ncbi:hypothetical protein Srut_31820 [Streptomyces rutgersensis]|nr:hypothetical protein Srut_31820 [Streptomyces rutgersensis]
MDAGRTSGLPHSWRGRLTGDPPSRRTARWEIGASTCGRTQVPGRSTPKYTSVRTARRPARRGAATTP